MPVQEPTRDRLIHLDEVEAPRPLRRPDWLKVRAPTGETYEWLRGLMRSKTLHTVCEEAGCPNIYECWADGTATFMIFGPRRYGQAAAIDRGTAGRVGDLGTIAEQLGQKLEIGRFAAARAGAGEFEQRFEQLDAPYIGEIDPGTVIDRKFFKERHAGSLGLQQRSPGIRRSFEVEPLPWHDLSPGTHQSLPALLFPRQPPGQQYLYPSVQEVP